MKTILKEKKKQAIDKLIRFVNLPDHVERVIIKPLMSRYINHNTSLRNGFIFCPYHHEVNEPSFSWHKEKNYAYCFGCKQGGDVVMLHYLYLKKIVGRQGVTYDEAVMDLAELYHINIPEFIVDETVAVDAIREIVVERSKTKMRRISDIRKTRVISLHTIVKLNNKIMGNQALTIKQKLIKLEILDELVCLADTISINIEQLENILDTVGG